MAYVLDPGAIVAAASGVALLALALAVLPLRPRTLASGAFAALAGLWGAAVVAANLAQLSADAATASPWVHLFALLYVPLYLPALVFATAHPWPGPFARSRGALLAAAVPAVVLVALFVAAPGLYVAGFATNADGSLRTLQGPLLPFVLIANSVLVFAVALAVAARRLFAATRESERSQLGLVVAALLLYVSYRGAEVAGSLLQAETLAAQLGAPAVAFRVASAVACLGVAAAVAARAARDRALPWRDLMLAAAALPFAVGVVEALVAPRVPVASVGVWRLGMAGVFAYALARHRLFDVEVRLRDFAPYAGYAATVVAGLALLAALAGPALAASPPLAGVAVAGLLAACVPAARLAQRGLARAAPQLELPEYIYKRKIDVYRAALEEAEAKGVGEVTEQAFLSELRRGLGISEQEHRLLLLFLRSQERFQSGPPRAPLAKDGTERFRIERELGSGSFGRALLALDTRLDRRVVLKQPVAPWVLEGEGRALFLQEARLAARIHHPNVVAVHEVLPDADPPMLVLEYVEGGSLEALLAREPKVAPERALAIARGVLDGLDRIHRAGIVHRDVKPANILLDAEGTPKLTDFGIARSEAEAGKLLTVAAQGVQPGSLAYMSPEQARGEPVDARSDLFAVGVLLHQMLTGRHYLDRQGRSAMELRRLVQQGPQPDLAEVPQELRPALARAMAADPAARYESAAAMARELERAGTTGPAARTARRRPA